MTFLKADWEVNGTGLSNGSTSCLDLNPTDFSDSTLLNLTAKAGDKESRISITLVRVAHPVSGIIKGDGQVESLELWTDSTSGSVKDGLDVQFELAGLPLSIYVYPELGKPMTGAVMLKGLVNRGGNGRWGQTGFADIMAKVRQYLFGHLVTTEINLRDGVNPILLQANFRWSGEGSFPAYLDVKFSEPLSSKIKPSASLFMIKQKNGLELDLGLEGSQCFLLEGGHYRLQLTESLALKLGERDSISLGALARDSSGNGALPHFQAMNFTSNSEVTIGNLSILENPARGEPFNPAEPTQALNPVSASRIPVLDREADRSMAMANGPVIIIPCRVPVLRIKLLIHDNLGGLVNEVLRIFSTEEWNRIEMASAGDTTWLRLMWYPVSASGQKSSDIFEAKSNLVGDPNQGRFSPI